jgi:hypothetical protein
MTGHSHLTRLVLAAAVLSAAALPAAAKSGVNVGALSCTVEGGIGLIIGSSKDMQCVFNPADGGASEHYTGTISKLGIDIGITNESYIRWLVFAPGTINRGALAGGYAGASAEATLGVGLGANVLVGGLDNTIALQPVSIQGQEGLNVAAGVTSLNLDFAE